MISISLLVATTCIAASYGFSDQTHPLRPWWNTPGSSARIVGGYEVDILDVPFQVSLTSGYGHFCGGSLVHERWVLTAGHCADHRDVPGLQVRVGSTRHATGGQLVKVKRVVRHPKYNSMAIDYDFSLLELEKAVELNDQFYVVELPKEGEPVVDGACLQVSGWGNTQNSQESRDVLRATNVPAVNQKGCEKAYGPYGQVTDRMLCAGFEQGGKDACQGDSGGPLVQGNKLVGVVSWGLGCAQAGFPGVYSRVASVRQWVKETSGV